MGKYRPDNLLAALRLFVEARNKAVASGFTDNGGAIHSVERILDILSCRIRYPDLGHINTLKKSPEAEISKRAHAARKQGEAIYIEHVMPQRAFAKEVVSLVTNGASDDAIIEYIRNNYRLVLLTKEETTHLNRLNRSRISADRIADAGIKLHEHQ